METERGIVKFIKNGIMLTAVSLSMRILSVRFNAFALTKLGEDGMGQYTLIMSVYTFAVTLASAGVSLASNRMCAEAENEAERNAALKRCAAYAGACGVFSCSLLLIFGEFIGTELLGDERCVLPLRLLALSMPPIALSNVMHGYFSAVRKVSRSAAVSIFEQLFKIFLTVYLFLYVMPNDTEYACSILIGSGMLAECVSFLLAFILFLIDRKNAVASPHGQDKKALTSKLFSIVIPVAAAAYVRSALTTIEHILIPRGLRKNPATADRALASYGIFCGMVMPIIMLPTALLYSFTGLLITEFAEAGSRDETGHISSMSAKAINLTLIFSLGCAAGMYCFSNELGMMIYQSSECGKFIKLMSPLIPVMYLDHAVDSMLKGIGEQVYCMKVNILDAAMCTLLVFLLCGRIGIYGYVLTIYVSELINASMSIIKLCSRVDIRLELKKVMRPLTGAFAAVFALGAMPHNADILNLILRIFVFSGIYIIASFKEIYLIFFDRRASL